MASMADRLVKLREERVAREKARIEKLRELNLKKYNKNENQPQNSTIKPSVSNLSIPKPKTENNISSKANLTNPVKNNFHVNGTTKRPITAPITKKPVPNKEIPRPKTVITKTDKKDEKAVNGIKNDKPQNHIKKPEIKIAPKVIDTKKPIPNNKIPMLKNDLSRRKTLGPQTERAPATTTSSRKSMLPTKVANNTKSSESVFDRLYKPKTVTKPQVDDVLKLQTDPNYLKKVIKESGLILNKRHTLFAPKPVVAKPVRRSISAVHFKRIDKSEISNCIHKWSSIGEKLDKVHLEEISEDENVKQDKVISAVKSERKKVKFLTPVPFNCNTPRPEELQARLKNWLQKRGKSIDSYHHLQCFGIHHAAQKEIKPLNLDASPKFDPYDDENKENIPVDHDSDNDSYTDNMNDRKHDFDVQDKWRRASSISDSICDLNESHRSNNTTLTSTELHHVDELVFGALNDLTELLKEGFDWEQCARWLRAIRERFPSAPETAAYWECRAALEERRGDLPASVQCWEEAIAKGTEESVAETNLDQLLDKFMQLKISPNSCKKRCPDPKMVDVKNVFKSTIIRFAVQQAKLRQSNQGTPKYTVTPVRRSARLSAHWSGRALKVCSSVRQAAQNSEVTFVPNSTLLNTP